MDLSHEIERTIAKLNAGADPGTVLEAFALKVQSDGTQREIKACAGCGEEGVLCVRCKAKDVLGEQAVSMAPMALFKFQQWLASRGQEEDESGEAH
jgi:hypothetical protein